MYLHANNWKEKRNVDNIQASKTKQNHFREPHKEDSYIGFTHSCIDSTQSCCEIRMQTLLLLIILWIPIYEMAQKYTKFFLVR